MVLARGVVAVLLLGSGCADDHFPPLPGGGGGGGGGGGNDVDAATTSDGAGPAALAGRVCEVTDLRSPLACQNGALAGVSVTARELDATTTTDDSGRFSFATAGEVRVTLVVGAGTAVLRPSLVVVPVGDDVVAPVVSEDTFAALANTLGVINPAGDATVALYVRDGEDPLAGALVEAPSGTLWPPYYDAGGELEWAADTEGTGPAGAALLFAVPAVQPTATIGIEAGLLAEEIAVPVAEDSITFATIDLAP